MKNCYVKSRVGVWCKVSKTKYTEFVEYLRKGTTNVPEDKKDAYIATRTYIMKIN